MTAPSAHSIAVTIAGAAAGLPIAGMWFQPFEWCISVTLSVVGSLVAVWIHERASDRDRLRRERWEQDIRSRERLLREREAKLERSTEK